MLTKKRNKDKWKDNDVITAANNLTILTVKKQVLNGVRITLSVDSKGLIVAVRAAIGN